MPLEVRRSTSWCWAGLAIVLAGCGPSVAATDGGTDARAPIDAASVPLTDVAVHVTSSVPAFAGKVRIGAFRMSPPTMPPLSLAVLDAPTFPADATLRDLEPGTYYVLGVLDFDPPSLTLPGPEDTTTASDPITITGEETAPVEVTLDLPPAPMP